MMRVFMHHHNSLSSFGDSQTDIRLRRPFESLLYKLTTFSRPRNDGAPEGGRRLK